MPQARASRPATGIGLLLLVGFSIIPEGHTASGFLDRLSREVGGSTVESIRSMIPKAAVASATDRLCGSRQEAWCRNLTNTVVGSFSEEFVARMTREDIEQATEARERSIRTGEPQVWENRESGARGVVESVPAQPRPPTATAVTVEETVEVSVPILDAVGEQYLVRADSAWILSGPGPQFTPIAELARGARINAIARVQQSNWFLVGEGPIGKGYLDGDTVELAPLAETVREAAKPAPKPAPTPRRTEPKAPAPATPATRQVEVAMAAECYTTTQGVTLADGASEEASVTSCRTPNGWVQV